MSKQTFTAKVLFTFTGTVLIQADSAEEAEKIAQDDVGLKLGGTIHTSNQDRVIDWEFGENSGKKIIRITKNKKEI